MPRGVYHEFVTDSENLIELISYCLYKKVKLQCINNRLENGTESISYATIKEIQKDLISQKNMYYTEASRTLNIFLQKRDADVLRDIIKQSRPTFGQSIISSIIATLFTTLFISIIYISIYIYFNGFEALAKLLKIS